jgi:hypothetical protein
MVDTLYCVPSKAWVGLFDERDTPTGICTMKTIEKNRHIALLERKCFRLFSSIFSNILLSRFLVNFPISLQPRVLCVLYIYIYRYMIG